MAVWGTVWQTNSIRHNFTFNCNKMIYLQSLILERIYVCGNKKSTNENWIRHGSISFSWFRTCASMDLSVCARVAMEMIRIHVYAYEWTNILVYILWLDLQWICWKSAIKSVVALPNWKLYILTPINANSFFSESIPPAWACSVRIYGTPNTFT